MSFDKSLLLKFWFVTVNLSNVWFAQHTMSKYVAEGPRRCPRCSGRVYAAEEVVCEGQKWHKKSFGCKDCGKKLDSTTCNTHDGRSDYSYPQARVVQWLEHSPPTNAVRIGFKTRRRRHAVWVEFVVGSHQVSPRGFSPSTPVFPPPQKPTFPILHFDQHISCLGLLPLVVIYHYWYNNYLSLVVCWSTPSLFLSQ